MSAFELNELGQPIGLRVHHWQSPTLPSFPALEGFGCRIEPLSLAHAPDLHEAFLLDREHRMWTYLSIGPFPQLADFQHWITHSDQYEATQFYAIIDMQSGKALGFASYLRMDPAEGCIEVGWLTYSPLLQQSRLATAAMYLMMEHAFSIGYRRYEWKCNALNAPSRRAAARLGFSYEGTFRQARVDRGRNRDTAWFSILDSEWPALQRVFQSWLADDNFSPEGKQRTSLSTFTRPLVTAWYPGDKPGD
ncbi:GNAT family N-acetyltransferase [Burkholderiaceae bacterium DAT-1]|nr:GNAT family N-acetyltransferase [Burkholderiaceae bacterium DAT-1]